LSSTAVIDIREIVFLILSGDWTIRDFALLIESSMVLSSPFSASYQMISREVLKLTLHTVLLRPFLSVLYCSMSRTAFP
jgi:hypothetical protein